MRNATLSENQYAPKLKIPANTKAKSPCLDRRHVTNADKQTRQCAQQDDVLKKLFTFPPGPLGPDRAHLPIRAVLY